MQSWWSAVSALGSLAVTGPLGVAIALWLVAGRSWRLTATWVLLFGAGMALVVATKVAFIGWGVGIPEARFAGLSGHAMRACAVFPVAFYLAFRRAQPEWRRGAFVLGVLLAALVSYSRLPVLAHSTSEVVLGAGVGYTVAAAFINVRLSSIKLSGFKSFVDPTNFQVPGQLVGVVGSQRLRQVEHHRRRALGAGRIEGFRTARRVDAGRDLQRFHPPQAGRPRLGRTGVRQHDGKAAGQWGQYAEIAVKRTLTRDGTSTYYINGQPVRRRDIQDIFLGTGLGPRAYAIIGQGMIARIIESRPEELRVFLEEAAGVSKYKERRRETENRLHDTRENLLRVEDILRELNANLEKLKPRPRWRPASTSCRRPGRKTEAALAAAQDEARPSRPNTSATWSRPRPTWKSRPPSCAMSSCRWSRCARPTSPPATACTRRRATCTRPTEIGSLEAQIKFVIESRSRLQHQLATLTAQRDQWQNQAEEYAGQIEEAEFGAGRTGAKVEQAQMMAEQKAELLPTLEAAWREAQNKSTEVARPHHAGAAALELESAHQRNANNILNGLATRRERCSRKRRPVMPDSATSTNLRMQLEEKQQRWKSRACCWKRRWSSSRSWKRNASEAQAAGQCRVGRQRPAGSAPERAAPDAGTRADAGQGHAMAAKA
jgi:membrane-associated phospholipid phosphatase